MSCDEMRCGVGKVFLFKRTEKEKTDSLLTSVAGGPAEQGHSRESDQNNFEQSIARVLVCGRLLDVIDDEDFGGGLDCIHF